MDSNDNVTASETNKITDSTANIVLIEIGQIAAIVSSLVNSRRSNASLIYRLENQDCNGLTFKPEYIATSITGALLANEHGVSMNYIYQI